MKDRQTGFHVRNAHNLYLETLATLGPLGLTLLSVLLTSPVVAAIRSRRSSLCRSPAALTRLSLTRRHRLGLAASCGHVHRVGLWGGVLVAARGLANRFVVLSRFASRSPFVVFLFLAALVGLRGNLAIAASNNAADASKWAESARRAHDAKRWMPWSSDPWRLEGEAQYVLGQDAAARANFRKAVAKDPNNWLVWADLATVSPRGSLAGAGATSPSSSIRSRPSSGISARPSG